MQCLGLVTGRVQGTSSLLTLQDSSFCSICREWWLPILQVQVHPILERRHRTATGHVVARNVLPACSQGTECMPMLWLVAVPDGRPPLQPDHKPGG